MSRSRLASLAIAATVTALAIAPFLGGLELRVYDLLTRWSQPAPSAPHVAVVAIDDESLGRVGQWPWPRAVMATLVERLQALEPSAIALDVIFSEVDHFDSTSGTGGRTTGDTALARAIGSANVATGFAFTFTPRASSTTLPGGAPFRAAIVERPGMPSPVNALFQATGCVCPLPEIANASAASGFLNADTDPDGRLRRMPLLMAHGEQIYPSLALAAARLANPDAQVAYESRRDVPLQIVFGEQRMALGERATLGLRLPPAGTIAHISAADVLAARVEASSVAGRVLFVGTTALGIGDRVTTPLGTVPGVEVQAAAAENILAGTFVAPMMYASLLEGALAVTAALASAWLMGGLGYRRGALAALGVLALAWAVSPLLLAETGRYLSPLPATLALGATLALAGWVTVGTERQRAEEERRRRLQAHGFIAKSLTSLMEIKDPSTGRHARRTQGYSRLLMQPLSQAVGFADYLTPDRIDTLSLLAPLHDIGKVGIRDAVLNKPGSLTRDEMHEMRQHPVFGFETIARAEEQAGVDSEADRAILQLAKDIVYTHHERWDGTGYPRGLKGREIPIAGRVMAVVDVYDALVEPRPYRRQLPHSEAVALIIAGRGTQFDPDVVEAFLSVSQSFDDLRAMLPEDPPAAH